MFTFSRNKMNANYAEICRVSNLEGDYQLIPLVHFSEISTILLWNINNSKSAKNSKKEILFLDKNLKKKNHVTIEIA